MSKVFVAHCFDVDELHSFTERMADVIHVINVQFIPPPPMVQGVSGKYLVFYHERG